NRHVDFLKRDIIKAMNKAAALDELISEVERHSLGEGYGSRKTVPDPGGGRNKKQPDAGSQ
ncbi:DNA-packaging protein, partial [Escherichia coli]|nr:DNA-packaging protein [Escherichia coli]